MEMVVKGFWVGGFRCLGGFLGDGCFLWGVGVGLVGWGGVGWWNGMGGVRMIMVAMMAMMAM